MHLSSLASKLSDVLERANEVGHVEALPDFCELADSFMVCGFAAAAARCRSWSLVCPDHDVWRKLLREWSLQIRTIDNGSLPLAANDLVDGSPSSGLLDIQLQHIQSLVAAENLEGAVELLVDIAYQQGLPSHLCNRVAMLKEKQFCFFEAERWYRTSLSKVENQPLAWFGLASTLLNQNLADEALEAAQIGLSLYPRHPWGLKLQQRSLLALAAHQSLCMLAQQDLLPLPFNGSDSLHLQPSVDLDISRVSVQSKMVFSRLFSGLPSPLIWLLGPYSHLVYLWCLEQELIPAHSCIQSFGNPDAVVALAARSSSQVLMGADLPCYQIKHQQDTPDLAIVLPQSSATCPLAITGLARSTSVWLLSTRQLFYQFEAKKSLTITSDLTLWLASSHSNVS